jgi:YbbR domain-containing protein
MKILKRIGAILINNLWLKILAVAIAFIVWMIAAQINNPVSTHTYSNVRVTLLGTDVLENEGKVYQILNNSDVVKVTVRAPESVISTLSATDIQAVADLSRITEDGTVPIVYTLERAESIVADHDELQVLVEEKKTKYVNISYEMVGSVGDGCVAGKVNLERNRIEVSGPKSAVDKVAYAQVTIDLDGAVKTISADMEIILYDEDGRRVDSENIIKQTDYVTTTVTVLSTKDVPIYASVTGNPANGYIYPDDIEVYPGVITIAGDTSTLNSIAHVDITDPVDIGGSQDNVFATFDITKYLPSGVSIEEPGFDGEVTVIAYIEKLAEKNINIPKEKIGLLNIPEGFTAEIIEDGPIVVHLSGLSAELNAISSESLAGIAEITPNNSENIYIDGEILIIPVKFNLSSHVNSDVVYIRVLLTADVDEETDTTADT